jgi:hypothetical protein
LERISWMRYFDPDSNPDSNPDLDHLFFVIVAKLVYLLLLEWLEVSYVIILLKCIRSLIAAPKIRRLWHPCILASLHPCILNSNAISLNFIHLFIMSANWFIDSLTHWLIDSLIHWFIDYSYNPNSTFLFAYIHTHHRMQS